MNTVPVFIELPSAPMQDIYRTIRQLVGSDLPFFITGETGVGKEGIARYIHENGPRRDKPFVAINCGRFTAELLQSELFGHEKGAFTGANYQRRGAFERTKGGILFLDEIAEMSLEAQTMLLRVLDAKTFTRLGGNENLTADFHIIAATNKNIGETVLKGEFRPDLYYRLMDVMLDIPALRERPEDIAPLVEAFIGEFGPEYGKDVRGITPAALTRLEQAAWPGNIRQLKVAAQTAVALTMTHTLEVKDFPYNFFTLPASAKSDGELTEKKDIPDTQDSISTLISQLRALPVEAQCQIIQTVSERLPSFLKKETLSIENMNLPEILCQIAQTRIEKYPTLVKAAASLGIDTRTLKVYAHRDIDTTDDSVESLDFF